MKFVSVTSRCLGCKASLTSAADKGNALCVNCEPRTAEIYLAKQQHLASCERIFWMMSVQCQRITGENYKDVLGIARDSAIYYQVCVEGV